MEKTKKPYKNRFFKGGHPKMWKHGFLAKIAWHDLCQEGRKRIFVHTICFSQNFFWTKTVQSRKHYKIGVSAEIAKKNKNDTFFLKKVFFDMAEKVGFTNCVFEKLCFLKALFL